MLLGSAAAYGLHPEGTTFPRPYLPHGWRTVFQLHSPPSQPPQVSLDAQPHLSLSCQFVRALPKYLKFSRARQNCEAHLQTST